MLEVIDAPRVAEVIILNQVYVTVEVTLQRSIGIVVVFGVIGVTIVEVRGTRIGQVLLCIVLDGLQLITISGDDEAVYQPVMPLIVHAVSFNAGYVAVLVVGYALGVTFFAILVDIIYFWVAKESKSLSKKGSQDVGI